MGCFGVKIGLCAWMIDARSGGMRGQPRMRVGAKLNLGNLQAPAALLSRGALLECGCGAVATYIASCSFSSLLTTAAAAAPIKNDSRV